MSDGLGDGRGDPTPAQTRLYERWAEGGAALSLIGEVQCDPRYPEAPGNLALTDGADEAEFRALAVAGSRKGAQLWPQIGHAGALAHPLCPAPCGPSALSIGDFACEEMSVEEISALPARYARSAALAKSFGFSGAQIHAGHGFLLSQFLSPLFNRRDDAYGGSLDARFRLIGEIADAVRAAVGPAFPIGIKINSTDQLEGGLDEDQALEVVRKLDATSVDLIEISGGSYFPGAAAASEGRASSGPYFAAFARRAKGATRIPIVATGGFKNRAEAVKAVTSGAADAVGLARSMALSPSLPADWLAGGRDPTFPAFDAPPPGGVTAWFAMRLAALGEDAEAAFDMTLEDALAAKGARDAAQTRLWKARFG